jgi:hypothetical protein
MRDKAMPLLPEPFDSRDLSDQLRTTHAAAGELITDVMKTCRRFPSAFQTGKVARIKQLIEVGAFTDAALALIDLELPLWQVRRIAYDGGEWYCALSRQRELPEWLDRSVEAHHADLAAAILIAFGEAKAASTSASRTSVPIVPRGPKPLYEPVCCENFS